MPNKDRMYVAIDLKSFYASVECVDRGFDPLTTNLVVADASRTEKTICLAVSPSLKAFGIPGRARLFEVIQRVKEVNQARKLNTYDHTLKGISLSSIDLQIYKDMEVGFYVAPPRMAHYMEVSTQIYNVYLKYVAPEDIHVYSVDEVFIDVTDYLKTYKMTAKELAVKMMKDVLATTGITATAGVGTNLYLCKIAMDIVAKHVEADENGARIACLDERSYRELLWNHRPLTDFWRVGKGYATKLERYGIKTMGDIARWSLKDEDLFYKLFGVNAELLIDHAWGYEPCLIKDIKAYRPETNSFSSGQVLKCPYTFKKARIVVQEMADAVALDLVDKKMVTDQMLLTVGYDIESLENPAIRSKYKGEVTIDRYGRKVPKHAHGTKNLGNSTSSSKEIIDAVVALYDELVNPDLLIRRLTITTNHVVPEVEYEKNKPEVIFEQMDLFTDYDMLQEQREAENEERIKERKIQEAMLSIQKKYGKNAIIKGTSMEDGATMRERNEQIGGHKA